MQVSEEKANSQTNRKPLNFRAPIVRYPIAILIVILGYVVALNIRGSFPFLFITLFIAIALMYELLWISILGLIAYGIFGAIAALPTSVAIIIGALIIANKDRH